MKQKESSFGLASRRLIALDPFFSRAVSTAEARLQRPAVAVLAADQSIGFRTIDAAKVLGVPLDLFAQSIGDVAEVIGLGEQTRVMSGK